MRRRPARPLEKAREQPRLAYAVDSRQIIADVREHFPEFEGQLVRDFPHIGSLDAFAGQPPAALAYVLVRVHQEQLARVRDYLATILTTGTPAAAAPPPLDEERLAIQSEGDDARVQPEPERRAENPQPAPVRESKPAPSEPTNAPDEVPDWLTDPG